MKHFFDTEFHEYYKQPKVLGCKNGKAIPTIDLISIGIVNEENKTFYAISKDFNIKDAWNSYQLEINKHYPIGSEYNKVYWLRENVLRPIFNELLQKELGASYKQEQIIGYSFKINSKFNLKNLSKLIYKYGKTNNEISNEIKIFVADIGQKSDIVLSDRMELDNVEFYAYYGDYDWVVLAQLFGKMINLPRGFPMFAYDLKQSLNEKQKSIVKDRIELKKDANYPRQENEHNALDDAKWNKRLYEFLQSV